MHVVQLPSWFGVAVMALVCGAALWKGGGEERAVALCLLLGWIATLAFRDRSWIGPQWAGLAIDGAFLLFIGVIALRSARFWPIWAAGFQLLAILTHGARMIDPNVRPWAYATAGVIWTQLMLLALAVGSWAAWRERRQLARAGVPRASPGVARR